jgi:hypothetical protein
MVESKGLLRKNSENSKGSKEFQGSAFRVPVQEQREVLT